jgi:CotS family spore coat protein
VADQKGNDPNKGGGFFHELWKELTKPPKWAKVPPKPDSGQKKDDGKKHEADASQKSRKRQPPSWWSWSQSDGVPRRRHRERQSRTVRSQSRAIGSVRSVASEKLRRTRSKRPPKSAPLPISKSRADAGSQFPAAAEVQAAIRRHGFAPAILKQYGLTASKVEPFGPVLRLRTNQGLIALKKTHLAPKNILFLHGAFQHLEEKRFTKFAPFLLTTDGRPYGIVGGDTYYITRWLRGQEVDFRSSPQLALAARTLAEFHEASRGYEPEHRPAAIFDMVDRFADRRDELLEWKKRVQKKRRPDGVDQFFLQHVDLYVSQCAQALTLLKKPEIRAHLLYEEEDPCLCHLDLTPYNMVFTQNNQVALIDLDFCTYGPRTLDLAHLMRRALQRQEWDQDAAWHCLVNYNSLRMLTRPEYRILQGLLIFPHRFWRIAYEHYDVGHDPNHLGYFQLCEAEESKRQAFLTTFGRQIDRMG